MDNQPSESRESSDPEREFVERLISRLERSNLEQPGVPDEVERKACPAPTIPGYKVISELGHGGMGVVYKARQLSAERDVALKMILVGPAVDSETVRRFETEVHAAAKLKHRGIVPIYEVGEHDARPYFSMEFVEGGSLEDWVKKNGPMQPDAAARLVVALTEAIQYAHEQGVIHRDLKPKNILLDAEGSPRICDFGLAKLMDGAHDLTRTGDAIGTPSYMPPEQAKGLKDAREKSDIYGLGGILYCLLTGRPPFQAANAQEIHRQVLEEDVAPARTVNPGVPKDLETICEQSLRKDPDRRYLSTRYLGDDLRRFLAGEPILARPIGWRDFVERALRYRNLDERYDRDWNAFLLLFTILLLCTSIGTFVFEELNMSAYGELSANLGLCGILGMIAWKARRVMTPAASRKERQVASVLAGNIVACLCMNQVMFGSITPPYGTNVWAPSAVINGLALSFIGSSHSGVFYLFGAFFVVLGVAISGVPRNEFQWACLAYGLGWSGTLTIMMIHFRRFGKNDSVSTTLAPTRAARAPSS